MSAAEALVERLAVVAGGAGWVFVGVCVAWGVGELLGEVSSWR